MPTASIVKGRGYLNHNDRTIKQVNSRSWKAELSSQNIVYVNEPIQNVYHELFDPALENYNQSQIKKIIQNVKSKTIMNISVDPSRRNHFMNISWHLAI